MKKIYLIIILILVAFAAAWGPLMSNVEQAKYSVYQHYGTIEIRDYHPLIVAEVEVAGSREEAIKKGFRIIADYIFGNNLAAKKLAMTAPVTQETSAKIAMTAPVTQEEDRNGSWKIRFIMPSVYTIETLPIPRNVEVKLRQIPAKRYAVIRFSGTPGQKRLSLEQEKLEAFMREQHLIPIGLPIYAFFNPPWTLPILRRNEVMIEIKNAIVQQHESGF